MSDVPEAAPQETRLVDRAAATLEASARIGTRPATLTGASPTLANDTGTVCLTNPEAGSMFAGGWTSPSTSREGHTDRVVTTTLMGMCMSPALLVNSANVLCCPARRAEPTMRNFTT